MAAFASELTEILGQVVDTEQFFSGVTHDSFYSASWVGVDFAPGSGNTGILTVAVYSDTSGTAGAENWDDTTILSFSLASTTAPNKTSFPIQGPYKWRVGVINSSGSETTITLGYRLEV